MSWSGHFWTIAPHFSRARQAWRPTTSQAWSWPIADERYGMVTLRGVTDSPFEGPVPDVGSRAGLLVVVHGLGGSSESGYVLAASHAAARAGLSCLRLNLRGADSSGEDFYHGGLFQDLDQVLRDPGLEPYENLYLLGYSLGGHLALSWAAGTDTKSSRVRSVATICAPLDLARSAATFDTPTFSVYRPYVLDSLKATYRAVAARRQVPLSVRDAQRITRIREWDERIVAPRHGFRSASHYYSEASVAGRLERIDLPTLMVIAEHDPMVPIETLEDALTRVSSRTEVKRITRGGHVGFPAQTDLGLSGPLGIEAQVIAWLRGSH